MSESFATSRALTGAEEFDRRRRTLASSSPALDDPLAELARLVGHDDPFRGLSPQGRPAPASREPIRHNDPPTDFAAFDDAFLGAPDAGEEPGAPDDPAVVHAAAATPRADFSRFAPIAVRGERAPELSADAWARGGEPPIAPMPAAVLTATRETPVAEPRGSSQRTLIVLAAVVALTGGGLAASFLAKPAGGMAAPTIASAESAPTILAATGPTKVQPETPANDPNAPSEPSTLLDKNKNDGTATAKVVDNVEQPVDLSQAIKPAPIPQAQAQQAPAEDDPAAAAPSSPFPEPHKVKTILVRPDGSVITDRPAVAVADAIPTNTISQQASLAFDPKTSLPIVPNPADAAPVPAPVAEVPAADAPAVVAMPPAAASAAPPAKSQARVATTPKPRVAETKPVPTPKPKAATAKPKPVEEADATPTPPADAASSLASGKFGVQLGAAGSEAEAKGLVIRLGRKYAGDLGGAQLAVHKADVGSKAVYRVRLGGLSQEAAKAVCGKVSAGGGGCFVVRE